MRHRIVILGAGTRGTLAANRLRRVYGDAAEIVVIDRDDCHVYQPGLLSVPFGLAEPDVFTFFGMDAINKAKHEHVRVATVGNPGLHVATWAGGFPGASALVTRKLASGMVELDNPPIPEFIEMIADSGAGIYACQASVDLFGLTRDDFIPQVQGIMTVGEFYGYAAGGQIIFT